ncbi:MAG: TIM barrel protein, partial [Rhodospirillaceae bacterium]
MLNFAANLTMMFNELPFRDRFGAAKTAGFSGVEFLFPYDDPAAEIASRLDDNGLTQALFNLPPGDWAAGDRGMAALPGREDAFRASIDLALAYAEATGCKTLHVMAGIVPDGVSTEHMFETFVENLAVAADAFAAEGIAAVLEPLNSRDVPGYFLPHAADAARVIKAVDRPNVGLQFD